jgi:hypothetical protein
MLIAWWSVHQRPGCIDIYDVRRLGAFHNEMLVKKPLVLLMPVKTLGRQHGGDDWHVGFQLYAHQCADYRVGYKFMATDTAIYTKPAAPIAT